MIMTEITKNNCVYKTHPIFNLYAGSKDGRIIHIVKQKPQFGNKNKFGYMQIMVRRYGESKQKNFCVHKFVYECWRGLVPDGKEIDHIDDNKENNKLANLHLLTRSENIKKSMKNRTTFNNYKNRKTIKSTNMKTKEVLYFYSLYSASQHLNICSISIQRVCDGITKSALSKKDNCSYTFEYIEEDLPVNYIKSKNIRPRKKTDEAKRETKLKWWNKEWKCINCGTITKNNSKYRHIKKCPK